MMVPVPPPWAPRAPHPCWGAACAPRGREAAGDPAVGPGTGFSPDECCVGHAPGCRVRSWVPPLPPPLHPLRIPRRPWGAGLLAGGCTGSPPATPSLTPGCAIPLKPCKHRKGRARLAVLSTSPGAQPAPTSPPQPHRAAHSLPWPRRAGVPSLGCPRGIPPTQSGVPPACCVGSAGTCPSGLQGRGRSRGTVKKRSRRAAQPPL